MRLLSRNQLWIFPRRWLSIRLRKLSEYFDSTCLRWYLPLSGSFVVAGCGQPVFFSILQEICWSIALEPGREIFLTPAILWFPILTA